MISETLTFVSPLDRRDVAEQLIRAVSGDLTRTDALMTWLQEFTDHVILEEREACGKIAESLEPEYYMDRCREHAGKIAAAIRARA